MICKVNPGALLVSMEVGSPKWVMIPLSRTCSIVEDLSFDIGKACIHPEKVYTRTGDIFVFLYQRHMSKVYL